MTTQIVAYFLLSNLGAKEHSSDVHKLSKTESLYLAVFASHCAPPCVDIELSQQAASQAYQMHGEGPRIIVSVHTKLHLGSS